MAGIYLHIPFCHKACHYCDFHFSTSLKNKPAMVKSLVKEMELRKDYLEGEKIETIYLGGGTPSLLTGYELNTVFENIYRIFTVTENPEITLEANPDDLTKEKISELRRSPVNRLSIGIQSFHDKDLRWMNRSHNSQQAVESVTLAQQAGLSAISIDLIYGLPDSTNEEWQENLSVAFEMNVPHISAYCLTVEQGTALSHFIKTGKSHNISEEKSAIQFEILTKQMKENNFVHYEISNFCRGEDYAQHNSSYWRGEKYLGLGPSAHSYNKKSRQWNISNNSIYISSIEKGVVPAESETLTLAQKYNEYLLTSLRTIWGCDFRKVKKDFGEKYFRLLQTFSAPLITSGALEVSNEILLLAPKGKFISDRVISELFVTEEN